jgi:hypothetical protein
MSEQLAFGVTCVVKIANKHEFLSKRFLTIASLKFQGNIYKTLTSDRCFPFSKFIALDNYWNLD